MKTIRVAVADDQALFRSGLISLLNDMPGIKVVVEASDGSELLDKMNVVQVQVALVDYRMPGMNGIDTARHIHDVFPETRVLMLSMYDDQEFIVSAIENGANGYLTKDDDPEEILQAIQSVMSTGYYLNDRTSKSLISNLMNEGKMKPEFLEEIQPVIFADHEIRVIELIAKELSNKEIAEQIGKAERTIEGYRKDIMEKTGTRNSVGIIMYAIKNGVIKL